MSTGCRVKTGSARQWKPRPGDGARGFGRRRALERTNLGDARLARLDPKPEIITPDPSYLYFRKALPPYERITGGKGLAVRLTKPLFEAEDPEIRRSGGLKAPRPFSRHAFGPARFFRGAESGSSASYAARSRATRKGGYFYAVPLDGAGGGVGREALPRLIGQAVEKSPAT